MTTITQTITTLPTAPDPATMTPTEFSAAAAAYVLAQKAMVPELNTWAGQVNTVGGEVATNATTATTKASEASASADASLASAAVAQGVAAYAGAWSSLTGAKSVPLSVDHEGAFWILVTATADVTADEPGVSAKWARAYGGGVIYPRTSNIEFVAEDNGKIFKYTSGTFSQTFDESANLGPNWSINVVSESTGVITLDPAGAELIGGAATIALYYGDSAFLQCTGSALSAIVTRAPAMVLISTATASNSASVSFTGLTSQYDEYEIQFTSVLPQTDAAALCLRTSTNGGSSYDSGASDYTSVVIGLNADNSTQNSLSTAATRIIITTAVGNAANENGVTGILRIHTPSAVRYASVDFITSYRGSSGFLTSSRGCGERVSAAAIDAVQILFDSGNITSGAFKLYGIRRR